MKIRRKIGGTLFGISCAVTFVGALATVLPLISNDQLRLVLSSFEMPSDNVVVNCINGAMTYALHHCYGVLLCGLAGMLAGVGILLWGSRRRPPGVLRISVRRRRPRTGRIRRRDGRLPSPGTIPLLKEAMTSCSCPVLRRPPFPGPIRLPPSCPGRTRRRPLPMPGRSRCPPMRFPASLRRCPLPPAPHGQGGSPCSRARDAATAGCAGQGHSRRRGLRTQRTARAARLIPNQKHHGQAYGINKRRGRPNGRPLRPLKNP